MGLLGVREEFQEEDEIMPSSQSLSYEKALLKVTLSWPPGMTIVPRRPAPFLQIQNNTIKGE
jgi:hypothetical protein